MGKTKQSRRKNKRENPTGFPSVQEIEAEESQSNGETSACPSQAALQNIVDHLQGEVEDKVFALHSLASIFQSPESVKEVAQQKIVRIAGPLLLDLSSAVRNAAAGALRNLTSSGNHEICDLLIEQDIMTPLCALLQKYSEEWQLSDKAEDVDNVDTFAQAVHLLWNLCEGNNKAVQYFNERSLLFVLMKHISAEPKKLKVTLAVVQCLITVAEDNSSVCSALQRSEGDLYKLLDIKGNNSELLLLRVLTAGVLLRVKSSQRKDIFSPLLLDAIAAPLMHDQRKMLHKLSSIELGESANEQEMLQEVSQLLEAQQIALELLTNLCTDEDDETMDLDSSSASSEDIYDDSLFMTDPDFADISGSSVSLPSELQDMVVSQQLMQKIWEKTILPAENVHDLLHEHSGGQHLLKRVDVLRSRAFLCLNNLVPALDVHDVGGLQSMFQMWSKIATFVFKSKEKDLEVLEAASAAMRATLQKVAECSHDESININLQDIEFIFSAGQCSDPSVRGNVVKTVSVLGMMSVTQTSENSLQVFKTVGKYLLDTCGHESELWVLAETLDSLMDLFAEDETDQVAVELGLIDRLQALVPSFKHKVQVSRRQLGEHHALVSTVNSNLPRFIKYKSKRLTIRPPHL